MISHGATQGAAMWPDKAAAAPAPGPLLSGPAKCKHACQSGQRSAGRGGDERDSNGFTGTGEEREEEPPQTKDVSDPPRERASADGELMVK